MAKDISDHCSRPMQHNDAGKTVSTKKEVLLAYSGGIDSTAAARILGEKGYAVTLLTLDTAGDREMLSSARQKAAALGLPWRQTDVRERFGREVVDYFRESYLRGETPVPCTFCNPAIKWRTLYETALREGFGHIATGHYFRLREENGRWFVRRALDPAKDQSYYLWGLSQECLRMALAPMGDRIKDTIRKELPQEALPRESMGVCFLNGRSYGDFIRETIPGIGPGEIVDREGRVIGRHEGYPFYTIGQRRGLDIPLPWRVTGIDARNNRLTAGDDTQLYHRRLLLKEWNAPDLQRLVESDRISVRVRGIGRNPGGFARVTVHGENLLVTLDEPAWAAARGQAVVLYEGDLVAGGGILENYW